MKVAKKKKKKKKLHLFFSDTHFEHSRKLGSVHFEVLTSWPRGRKLNVGSALPPGSMAGWPQPLKTLISLNFKIFSIFISKVFM